MAQIQEMTAIDPWFLEQIEEVVELEADASRTRTLDTASKADTARRPSATASPMSQLAKTWKTGELAVREKRKELGVRAVFNRVDTCAAEFESFTPYLYSSYEDVLRSRTRRTGKKVMILGSGPNRIGQGIEFDYCCCHASFALQDVGRRIDHGELQSGDGLHRLRHQRPPLLRAAHARARAQHLRHREAGRRDRAVRRPDAADPGAAAEAPGCADHRHRSGRTSTWPKTASCSASCSTIWAFRRRRTARPPAWKRPARSRGARLSGAGAAQLRAGRARHGDRLRRRDRCAVHARGRVASRRTGRC